MRQDWPWVTVPVGTKWDDQMLASINRRMKNLEQSLKYAANLVAGSRVAGDGDTSPAVGGIRVLVFENSALTTVTGFTGGEPDQLLVVILHDSRTTLQNGASLVLHGGVDWVGGTGQTRAFITADGITWVEVR